LTVTNDEGQAGHAEDEEMLPQEVVDQLEAELNNNDDCKMEEDD
jgi:hypothetical protein